MATKTVSATEFKAKCLSLLDEVAESGQEIVVTKRGRPVARIVRATEPGYVDLRGSVLYEADDAFDSNLVEWGELVQSSSTRTGHLITTEADRCSRLMADC